MVDVIFNLTVSIIYTNFINTIKIPYINCFKFVGVFFMVETSRPLDALNKSRNKRVIVELKNGKQYVGTLKAFDIHINIVLEEAEERADGEIKRKLGIVFIRGDTIIIISPE